MGPLRARNRSRFRFDALEWLATLCAHDPQIDLMCLGLADRLNQPVLKDPQEFGLCQQGALSKFVQK
jgi:hypothetical protein